jgi:cysteine synthase B
MTNSQRARDLTDCIGHTPLLPLKRIAAHLAPVEVYAKAEWFNPSGSVKDRAAWNIVRTALADGRLTQDKVLLDATSGNMGIAYAMLGAALGFRVRLVMPANVTPERKLILSAYGAEMVFTDPMAGSDGAIEEARRIYAQQPTAFFYANQYDNPANWLAHYHGTAEEIWAQTAGRITHFVAALGTSGTFVGCGRRLRALKPDIRLIALQPDSPLNAIEGWKHMPTAIVPQIYDPALADELLEISTEDAQAMARALAQQEGLFVSPSAGGAVVGALRVAERLRAGVVVAVLADAGYKYISERFWQAC